MSLLLINYLLNSLSAFSDSLSSPSASAAGAGALLDTGATPRLVGAESWPAVAVAVIGFDDCFAVAGDATAGAAARGAVTAARVAGAGAGEDDGVAAGAALVDLPAGAPVRPTTGLPDDREGGVTATVEGKPSPLELNSSITSHFSSLITISGFNSGRCKQILTSIFPPVFLRVVGSESYKEEQEKN